MNSRTIPGAVSALAQHLISTGSLMSSLSRKSSRVSVLILDFGFGFFLGASGVKVRRPLGMGVRCVEHICDEGKVRGLSQSAMPSSVSISVMLTRAAISSSSEVSGMYSGMGGALSFHCSRPCVNCWITADTLPIFSSIRLKEWWGPAIVAVAGPSGVRRSS